MEFKGELKGFPREVVEKMLERQVEQGYERDLIVFEECEYDGFVWGKSIEKHYFWCKVILEKDFNLFFEKYPKTQTNEKI